MSLLCHISTEAINRKDHPMVSTCVMMMISGENVVVTTGPSVPSSMIFRCHGTNKRRQFWQAKNKDEREVTSKKRGWYYNQKNQTKLTNL